MKWLILAGLVAWPTVAGAQEANDQAALFNQEARLDLAIAETAGEAYGCGLRSDQWVDFTMKWVDQDIASKAEAIWPNAPQAVNPTGYGSYLEAHNRARQMYFIGLEATAPECQALSADGMLAILDMKTGYIP